VVIVRVEVAPGLAAGVTDIGDRLQAGAGVPPPLTLHVRLTVDAYPFSAVTVTVDVAELPGETAAGVEAPTTKAGPGAYFTTNASTPPPDVR
jgi:hypothetical protein